VVWLGQQDCFLSDRPDNEIVPTARTWPVALPSEDLDTPIRQTVQSMLADYHLGGGRAGTVVLSTATGELLPVGSRSGAARAGIHRALAGHCRLRMEAASSRRKPWPNLRMSTVFAEAGRFSRLRLGPAWPPLATVSAPPSCLVPAHPARPCFSTHSPDRDLGLVAGRSPSRPAPNRPGHPCWQSLKRSRP